MGLRFKVIPALGTSRLALALFIPRKSSQFELQFAEN